MKNFCILFTIILIFTAVQGLSAQVHVSQVRAESRNSLVRLTWEDSPDAQGSVYIFRSLRAFGNTVPLNIRPIIVNYGQQFYIDDIEDIENVYYFIAASDLSGNRYDVIIPHVNVVHLNINFPHLSSQPAPVLPVVPAPAVPAEIASAAAEDDVLDIPVQEEIPGISRLSTEQRGDRVIITFNSTEREKNPVLYRSMQPIRRPHDLLSAIVVQTSVTSPFADYPVPGIAWYYAVLYEDEIELGNFNITQGINATNTAVLISPLVADQSLRPIPLPALTMREGRQTSFFPNENIQPSDLSIETAQLLRAIQLPGRPALEKKSPRIFTIDLQESLVREQSALSQIIINFFAANDWEGARDNLLHYLTFPRTADVEIRARFYLAQSLYFLGEYREALMIFLNIRSHHQEEVNSWINAVLEAMTQ